MPTTGGITLRDSSPAERAMGIADGTDDSAIYANLTRATRPEWQSRSKPTPGTTMDKAVLETLAGLKKSMVDNFFDTHATIHSYPDPEPNMPCRRLITRVIYDPDTRVTPDEAMIYVDARPVLTDNPDADCWFDLDILSLLAEHNAKRSKIKDVEESRKSGEFVGLPPVQLADLVRIIR